MPEEISGSYKLVICSSQTSLLFGRLPVVCCCSRYRHLVRQIKGKKCVVNLYIYIMKSQDTIIKSHWDFTTYENDTFYTSLELSIWRVVGLFYLFSFVFFLSISCLWFLAALCKGWGWRSVTGLSAKHQTALYRIQILFCDYMLFVGEANEQK